MLLALGELYSESRHFDESTVASRVIHRSTTESETRGELPKPQVLDNKLDQTKTMDEDIEKNPPYASAREVKIHPSYPERTNAQWAHMHIA